MRIYVGVEVKRLMYIGKSIMVTHKLFKIKMKLSEKMKHKKLIVFQFKTYIWRSINRSRLR